MTSTPEPKTIIAEELRKPNPDWRLIEQLSRCEVDSDPSRVRFSVDAGHIQRLGFELVAKQETALTELIKNSYDADATQVIVHFNNHDHPGGTLIIEDDGIGMQPDVVRDAWMRISTANKKSNPCSDRYSRLRAGRKGIGRFAVQRLGQQLVLETEVAGNSTGLRVTFYWDREFTPGLTLHDIFNDVEEYPKDISKQGTRLTIYDLREAWSDTAMHRVWKAILLLQPPFAIPREYKLKEAHLHAQDPGFEVFINGVSSSRRHTELSIEHSFLSHALANITGEIRADGSASVTIQSTKLGILETQNFPEHFTLTGPVTFSTKYFIYIAELISGINVSTATEMSRTYGGIRIYRNGFRVQPYGEQTDDWLRLDTDVGRRSLLVPANNRNFFGQVNLDGENNPLFEETSSREGLIENDAFEELRAFVRASVEWAAKRIASIRDRKQTAGQRDFIPKPRPRKPSEVLGSLIDTLGSKSVIPDNSDDIGGGIPNSPLSVVATTHDAFASAKAELQEWENLVEEQRAASLQYEEMLRILASLGLSVTVFGHEIKGVRSSVATHLTILDEEISELSVNVEKTRFATVLKGLRSATGRMFDLGGYISGLMSNTESRQLKSLSVKGSVLRFADQFRDYMARQHIIFEIDVYPEHLRTIEMHTSEIDSVLLNFLTNSIKSLKRARAHPRKVRIFGREDGEHILIGFEDNGEGISDTVKGRIFDAFFTTTIGSDEDSVAGPGTGLGLKIVSDIAKSYGGDVSVGSPSSGYNCCIEFRVLSSQIGGH